MSEVRLGRRELAELIRDGHLATQCPECAAEVRLLLSDLGAPRAAARKGEKKEEIQVKCVSCSKPITPYAFAVRKGLCTECFAVMGAPLPKPGQEEPAPEPQAERTE